LRILLACEFYYPSVGGVQEVMRQLAERLVARGHSVTVATTFLAERRSREVNGVTLVEFKVSAMLYGACLGTWTPIAGMSFAATMTSSW